ncbi:MAG: dihydroorotate dehydrogenase electron transfer subunit, partial [Candidatus Omnitrophota bacterium]
MKKNIFQQQVRIISSDKIKGGYFKLTLKCPQIVSLAQPGQFVMLRLSDSYKPLLRRPFSIHRVVNGSQSTLDIKRKNPKADSIEILYKVVGKGTKILSEKKPGE